MTAAMVVMKQCGNKRKSAGTNRTTFFAEAEI